jgi:hypothetical protein
MRLFHAWEVTILLLSYIAFGRNCLFSPHWPSADALQWDFMSFCPAAMPLEQTPPQRSLMSYNWTAPLHTVQQGTFTVGNMVRLRRFAAKVAMGRNVTIGAAGGSISKGWADDDKRGQRKGCVLLIVLLINCKSNEKHTKVINGACRTAGIGNSKTPLVPTYIVFEIAAIQHCHAACILNQLVVLHRGYSDDTPMRYTISVCSLHQQSKYFSCIYEGPIGTTLAMFKVN